MRKALGEALVELGKAIPEVVVLDADVSNSTMTNMFEKAYPSRFFNMGIAEPGMVDTAVGLALGGRIPFVSAFAGILSGRAFEQISTCVAYNQANVKLLAGFAGVSDFKDGSTHYSIFDLALMRSIPGMTVLVPCDSRELRAAIFSAAAHPGPVYVRISREEVPPVLSEPVAVEIGKGRVLAEGGDVTLIATGVPVFRTLKARELLAAEGISARVVEIHTLKPLDEELVVRCARETGHIVTVEEHSVIGGLYGAVCETLMRKHPVPARPVGIRDFFPPTAMNAEILLDHCGLSAKDIAAEARAVLKGEDR